MKKIIQIITFSLATIGVCHAAPMDNDPHMNHRPIPIPNMGEPREADSTIAYKQANARMHQAMMINYTDSADIDFLKGMIAHHEGAVEMARVELKYGTDPKLRQFAQRIIDDQTREIQFMKMELDRYYKPMIDRGVYPARP